MRFILPSGIAIVGAVILCGCSTPAPNPNLTAYRMAVTKLAPEPVYNRIRTAHLPEPLPRVEQRDLGSTSRLPVMELSVTDEPLESVAKLLGQSANYSSYCSQKVAAKTVTFTAIGDINELAAALEQASPVRVEIDHEQRQVKVLPRRGGVGSGVAPTLPSS